MAKAKKQKQQEDIADIIAEIADEVLDGADAEEALSVTEEESAQDDAETAVEETTEGEDDAAGETLSGEAARLEITQEDIRLVEAILFASASSVSVSMIAERFPEDRVALIPEILEMLREHYAARGVTLVQRDRRWALRTAVDLGDRMRLEKEQPKKFTRAAQETLAIIAYHQPVTRAEIENIRGVATSPGALDALMEAGWIKPGKRREVPGRPVTWLTTQSFLDHFGLEKLDDLPGVDELKATGLLDKRPAIEAMPTADLFDESEAKEDINPNVVTDEDLIGKQESAEDWEEEETVSRGGGDDEDDDADADDDSDADEDDDYDDEDGDDDSDDDGDEDDSGDYDDEDDAGDDDADSDDEDAGDDDDFDDEDDEDDEEDEED